MTAGSGAERDGNSTALPLAGLRVLDLSRALSGPFCTLILGDLGADVVKIEALPDGDMSRLWGPFDQGISTYFLCANRNKRSLALDLRAPPALPLLRRLADSADVLVENFRPGTAESMGLDYATLSARNPRLIHAAISGFGRAGPRAGWPGFDGILQAYSGLMSVTGSVESGPMRVGVAMGDQAAGMWAAMGIMAAVVQRFASGRGQRVDVSLLSSLVGLLSVQAQRHLSLGDVPKPSGNSHPVIAPYGLYATADGPLSIAPATPEMWRKLCVLLGMDALVDDPRFADNALRLAHDAELRAIIESRLATGSREEWMRRLVEAGIPAGPVNNMDNVFHDVQVEACRMVGEIQHPTLGVLKQVANPITLGGEDPLPLRRPPPRLGEHSREVLLEWGLGHEEIDTLLNAGVVSQFAAT